MRYPESGELNLVRDILDLGEKIKIPPSAVSQIFMNESYATLDASSSTDQDGKVMGFIWEVDGVPHLGVSIILASMDDGLHYGTLTVSDDDGLTDSTSFEFWIQDGQIIQSADRLLGYYEITGLGESRRLRSSDGFDLCWMAGEDGELSFNIENPSRSTGFLVLDISRDLLNCFNGTRPEVMINGLPIANVDLETVVNGSVERDGAALICREESLHIAVRLTNFETGNLKLVSKDDRGREEKTGFDSLPIFTIGLVALFTIILFSGFTVLFMRVRIVEGPRNPHEDFIISEELLTNGNGFRKRKKIEWEAYLEE
jgi:hypothetical protein